MKKRLAFIMLLCLGMMVVSAQRKMIVVNAETKVPVRDVQVYTPEGTDMRTAWDGTFVVPDSFSRINFRHPHFEQRYLLKSEIRNDTVWLLPVQNALGEVIIWGHHRFKNRMKDILTPSQQQIERDKLPQVIPPGPDVLALAGWLFDITVGKKMARRAQRKKALKKVREQEAENERKWEMLRDSTAFRRSGQE